MKPPLRLVQHTRIPILWFEMARTDNEIRITPSVLDRLIDYEPELSREPPASRAKSLRQLREAVRRDLEWLLNTRQSVDEIPSGLEELRKSLAMYGLPDFTSVQVRSPSAQNELKRILQEALRRFEPRLIDVEVSIEPSREAERALRFRIDARLLVDPAPEPITFDTVLQLMDGSYQVQGG